MSPPLVAEAETTFDMASVGSGTNGSAHHELAEGFAASLGVNNYESDISSDPENPMNGATGTCFGLIEMRGEGWSGQGYCKVQDMDGDTYIVSWSPGSPPLQNSWSLIGGSGKWVGSGGGGSVTQTYSEDGGTFESTFSGEIMLQ